MNKQFIQLLLVTSTTATTTPSPTKSSNAKFPAFRHETESNGFEFGAAGATIDINTNSHVDGTIKTAFM